eukprot:FR744159.1.p1 GENE.FR744159.1~~FR744159.1.p1  ORF type:complete len:167 (+),score=5.80 FR744159.1:37-537(+)
MSFFVCRVMLLSNFFAAAIFSFSLSPIPPHTRHARSNAVRYSRPRTATIVRTSTDVASPADRKGIQWEVQSDEIFDLIDSNGDGAISLEELRAHLNSLGYQPETIDSLFVELDHNSDGSISRQEMRLSFMRYDINALRLAFGVREQEEMATWTPPVTRVLRDSPAV